jgi:WD40 repeat protein
MGNFFSDRKHLICLICHKFLKQPVFLPCKCMSVCKEHLENKNNQAITCQICNMKHLSSKREHFKENSILQFRLEKNSHINGNILKIKTNLEKMLGQMRNSQSSFHLEIEKIDLFLGDHFFNIRNEIDIKREILKLEIFKAKFNEIKHRLVIKEINRLSEVIMRRIEIREEELKKDFLTKKSNYFDFDIENEIKELEDFFRSPTTRIESVKKKSSNLKVKFEKIQNHTQELRILKNEIKMLTNADFDSEFEVLTNHLNSKTAKDRAIVCSFNSSEIVVFESNDKSIITSKNLSGHTGSIVCLTLHTFYQVISGSVDSTIKVWNLLNQKCEMTLNGHKNWVTCLKPIDEYNDDDNQSLLASGSADKSIKIWSLSSGTCLHTLNGHSDFIECLDHFSSFLLSASVDKTIKMWNLVKRECIYTLEEHTSVVRCLKVIPVKNIFASGSDDSTIKIWNLLNGQKMFDLLGHTSDVNVLESTSKSDLISCSEDGFIMIWNVNEGICLFKTRLFSFSGIIDMTFSSNTGNLIIGSRESSILEFDSKYLKHHKKCGIDFPESVGNPLRIIPYKTTLPIKKIVS